MSLSREQIDKIVERVVEHEEHEPTAEEIAKAARRHRRG